VVISLSVGKKGPPNWGQCSLIVDQKGAERHLGSDLRQRLHQEVRRTHARALMVANGCSTVSHRRGRQRRAQPGPRLGVAHEALTPRFGGEPVDAIGGDQFLKQAARLRRVDSALDATERGGGTLHHHGVLSDRSAESARGERHVLRSVRALARCGKARLDNPAGRVRGRNDMGREIG
jgi:hypothetical protein